MYLASAMSACEDFSLANMETYNIPLLLKGANRYKPIRELYEKAQNVAQRVTSRQIELLSVPPLLIPRNGQMIHNPEQKKIQILIKSSLSVRNALITLILELANVMNVEKNDAIFDLARAGDLKASEFVDQVETLEYMGLRTFCLVMNKLKEMYPLEWRDSPLVCESLERHMISQRKSGHSKIYHDLWVQCFSEKYRIKHPFEIIVT